MSNIINFGGGATIDSNSDVFIATYGTTTSAEIEAAYQAGKTVFVIGNNGRQMGVLLSRWSETIHYFVYLKTKTYLRLWVCENDVWSEPINKVKATPESHASTHASGGSDPITPADIGAATTPKSVTVTLSAASWDSTSKTQTVTVTGVSEIETDQLITPIPSKSSQSTYYDARILCTGQAENSLTFTCETVPTVDLTVYVVIQEVIA